MEKYVCCICGNEFEGFGNNPYPIKKDGRCCDGCNDKVIIARLSKLKENEDIKYEENLEKILNNLMGELGGIGESETLSIIVILLNYYLENYNRNLGDTITLIKKGYKQYLKYLEGGD